MQSLPYGRSSSVEMSSEAYNRERNHEVHKDQQYLLFFEQFYHLLEEEVQEIQEYLKHLVKLFQELDLYKEKKLSPQDNAQVF